MIAKSKASLKREEQRGSPATVEFKNQIIDFLKNAKPEIAYAMKRDLSVMTNMPFYRDRPQVLKIKLNPIELICEYAELLVRCEDTKFVVKLVRKLNCNQNQTIRKAAPKVGKKGQIWEHAIPAKIVTEELIQMILKKDLTDLKKMLEVYQLAGQRGITLEQDKLLHKYKCSMPEGWNWRTENIDPLARHRAVGIDIAHL